MKTIGNLQKEIYSLNQEIDVFRRACQRARLARTWSKAHEYIKGALKQADSLNKKQREMKNAKSL